MKPRHRRRRFHDLDLLESRTLLSAAIPSFRYGLPDALQAESRRDFVVSSTVERIPLPTGIARGTISPAAVSIPNYARTPQQVRAAYGVSNLSFGTTPADGTGQTIAIVIAYHYPTALADLQAFDAAYGLPDPPSFSVVYASGSQPATDPAGAGNNTWEAEAAMDIQWSHTIAPGASIVLVEASGTSDSALITSGVNAARNLAQVSVVSMSWGRGESSADTSYNTYFTTPSGHQGITFVAASGDNGSPGLFPAYSPNVVAVGGTTLNMDGLTYLSEAGWSGSGGGISTYESKPSYQSSVTQSSNRRTIPDIAFLADPSTGVGIYDGWDYGGWSPYQYGGTSLATPISAGLMAIANQGRALASLTTLNGASQTLPAIYNAASADFHDVTSGSNGGFSAAAGYDLVTGRGSFIGNLALPDVAGIASLAGNDFVDKNSNGTQDAGEPALAGQTVFLDLNNNGTADPAANTSLSSGTINLQVPDNSSTGRSSSLTFSAATGLITDVNVTINISTTRDADLTVYLIGPDSTQITLFSGVGSSGDNFTNTTLDDQATTSITSGSAPFTGTYRPTGSLATFNNKSATGTWTLKVVDGRAQNIATLNSWSLAIATAAEPVTTTAADGSFGFVLPAGNATQLAAATPIGYVPTTPSARPVTLHGISTNQLFGYFPTIFNAPNAGDVYYLWLDPTGTTLQIATANAPSNPAYTAPLSLLPSLRFNLSGSGSKVVVDFTNGSPLPPGGILVDGGNIADSELDIIGQSPAQQFTMTDLAIAPTNSVPTVSWQNLSTLSLNTATVFFSGSLSTLNYLNLNAGTTFYWM